MNALDVQDIPVSEINDMGIISSDINKTSCVISKVYEKVVNS